MKAGKIFSGKLTKKHDEDAGQDIHSSVSITIPPLSPASVNTGLRIAVPEGHVGLIWPRSGSSFKNHIETGAGCIDENYRGEVVVKLYNKGRQEFKIEEGDRIAQLLTIPINNLKYIQSNEIDETDRGESGFGSTGK